ncbi:hypothetical protein [Acinetobacter ursingii]|uniref:hypothetical protein n=1 Tax=Acinetobacter ursingii TaxID=108980 RepID=UPI001D186555|nr:hypothetical protein [Acinetobacter ursingii]
MTSLFFMLEDPTVKLPAEVKFTSGFRFTVRLFAVAANLMLPSVLLGGVLKSMLTLNEAIIDVKEG